MRYTHIHTHAIQNRRTYTPTSFSAASPHLAKDLAQRKLCLPPARNMEENSPHRLVGLCRLKYMYACMHVCIYK